MLTFYFYKFNLGYKTKITFNLESMKDALTFYKYRKRVHYLRAPSTIKSTC